MNREHAMPDSELRRRFAAVDRALLLAFISPSGECLSANENCLHTLGLSREEFVGRNMLDVFTPLLAPGELGRIRSRLRAGDSYPVRLRWPRGDGAVVQLAARFLPLRDDGDGLHTIMLLAADVTLQGTRERKQLERYRHLADVVDKTAHAVAITDAEFATHYVNSAFRNIFGRSRRHLLGTSPAVVFGADEAHILEQIRTALSSASSFRMDGPAYSRHGQKRWVRLSVNMSIDHVDQHKRIFFVFADITSAKLYDALQQTAAEAMAHDLPVPEILARIQGEMEEMLPGIRVATFRADAQGALHALSLSRGLPDLEVFHKALPQPDTPLYEALQTRQAVIIQDVAESRYPQRIKDVCAALDIGGMIVAPVYSGVGSLLGLTATFHRVPMQQSTLYERIADVLVRICALTLEWGDIRAELRMVTHYDPLTGLPNLALLSSLTEQALRGERFRDNGNVPVAALCVNIERFRRISRTWGFEATNEALKIVAQRLSAAQAPNDILAHSVADEFIMVSIACDAARARETGRRIQAALTAPFVIKNTEVILSANIGVSMASGRMLLDAGPGRIIEEARNALFRMKRGEHAHIHFFSESPEQNATDDISLEARLLHAIDEEKLRLRYQPQISLRDGVLHGVEALCRWDDADLGDIAPGKFIPLAEESGLIARLSDWVLREACRQLGDWRRRGIPVPTVSVNLSALNFRDAHLPDTILRYLENCALEPKDLLLELTETVLLDEDPKVLQTLYKARDHGLLFSLDDFGTGYSSLSYLQKLPISEMKLDRSFVQDLHENDVSRRLSKAIVRVGESLGLRVLAEGVENKAQLDLLKLHHYHVVQGYFLAKPLSPEAFEQWLEDWNPSSVLN